jgi:hypothetical protein
MQNARAPSVALPNRPDADSLDGRTDFNAQPIWDLTGMCVFPLKSRDFLAIVSQFVSLA